MRQALPSCVTEPSSSFGELVERLSEASVRRRWEAHRDIAWDDAQNEICADDDRWELGASWDPLATSAWYKDQAPERRASIGLLRHVQLMKASIEFESILSQGLLRFAATLPNRHPAFRYVYHEISEEAQHSMMFQEMIDRSGFDPAPSAPGAYDLFHKIARAADTDPVLFFLAVLAGEEVTDHIQRRCLKGKPMHPIVEQISRIHVTEEARHVSFARAFLREAVLTVDERRLRAIRLQAPFILDWTSNHIFDESQVLVPPGGVPEDVCHSISTSDQASALRRASVAKAALLCHEIGLADDSVPGRTARVEGGPTNAGDRS